MLAENAPRLDIKTAKAVDDRGMFFAVVFDKQHLTEKKYPNKWEIRENSPNTEMMTIYYDDYDYINYDRN